MKKIIISSALFVLASCSKTSGISNTSAIIGDDDRKASVEENLTKTLGTILLNGEAICTGFISAAGEITTAAHCVDDNLTSFTFRTFQGEQSNIVGVKKIFSKADVVKLNADVVMPGLTIGEFDPNAKTVLAALDSESSNLVVTDAGTAELNRGIIYHTLDTVPGSSGGALVQNNSIVGVHIGNISPSQNVAISLSTVGDADVSGLAIMVEGCNPFGTRSQRRACNIPVPSLPPIVIESTPRFRTPTDEEVGAFAVCMGIPNGAEAAACAGAFGVCVATGPVYWACVATGCAGAGASHARRCASEVGFIN